MMRSLRLSFLATSTLLAFLLLLSVEVLPSISSSSSSSSLVAAGRPKKLSEKDLGRIEDQWMENEDEDEDDTPFKFKKGPDGQRQPPQPSVKTEMAFVTLKGKPGKQKTDQLAGRWADVMMSAGIDVRGYSIEENRILFVCDQRGAKDMNRVRQFVLKQSETEEFEWNSRTSKPGDVINDEGEANDPMAQFQAMQEEQQAKERREQRKKRKAAQERKRKQEKERKKKEAEKKKKAKEAEEKKKKKEAEEKKKVEEAAAAAAAAAGSQKTEL